MSTAQETFHDDASPAAFVAMLKRQWKFVAAIVVAAMLVALIYSALSPARYEATATVMLRTAANEQMFPPVGSDQDETFVRQPESELEFAESDDFETSMEAYTPPSAEVEVSYVDSGVTAVGARRSNLLDFTGQSNDADDAVAAANAWAENYISIRQSLTTDEVDSGISTTNRLIDSLNSELDEILAPLAPIDRAIARTTDPDTISKLTTQRLALQQSLSGETGPVEAQRRILSDELATLEISAQFLERPDISARMNRKAEDPKQTSPLVGRNLAFALVIGLVVGFSLAPLRDKLQTGLSDRKSVEAVSGGIPVIAELPRIDNQGSRHPSSPAIEPASAYAEGLERLVTAMGLIGAESGGRRVLITSAMPAEGKTTVAAHLSIRLAMAGTKTAVVDADLRRPNLHNVLGFDNHANGLADVLIGDAELWSSMRCPSDGISLAVLSAGHPSEAPASLVRSRRATAVLNHLAREFEVVVVDSPPTLPVTDSQALATNSVDHVLVVVRCGQTSREQLVETIDKLTAVGRRPTGIVITESKAARTSYGYAYGYGYRDIHQRLPYSANGTSVPIEAAKLKT